MECSGDDIFYQCSGMNDPAATAISIRRPWAQWPDPATLDLFPHHRRPSVHNAGRRYAPWMHRNPAGFGCGLSGNCYWRDPSQLIVIFCIQFIFFLRPATFYRFFCIFIFVEVIGF